jgi:hypothetical protein
LYVWFIYETDRQEQTAASQAGRDTARLTRPGRLPDQGDYPTMLERNRKKSEESRGTVFKRAMHHT